MLYIRQQNGVCREDIQVLIERAQWLVMKGAILDTRRGHDNTPARHIIALDIAVVNMQHLHWGICEPLKSCTQSTTSLLRLSAVYRILETKGITASVSHYYYWFNKGSWLAHREEQLAMQIRVLLNNNPRASGTSSVTDLTTSHQVLRFLTFMDLGLTNTCRSLQHAPSSIKTIPFDADDAVEIQEEKDEFTEELESLAPELQMEFDELETPLWEVVQTRWCVRVREFLVERGEAISQDYLCSLLQRQVIEVD
ncbi:hypothetical protein BDW74DRAFT_180215 [Aspergillus multicolor]|uniref:uncharacterized protein n=1 Tax=Aspergillus multicolor TaxID=41759 RepID=UPI003CCD350F